MKKGPFCGAYFENFQNCDTEGAFRPASPLPMKQIIPGLQTLKLSLPRKIDFQTGGEDFFLGKYLVLTKK